MLQGLEVTVHERPITVNGWQGSGYSILDPEYGVGAYKISGGASGGFLIILGFIAIALVGIMPVVFGGLSFFSSVGLIAAGKQGFDFAEKIAAYDPVDTNDLNGDVMLLVIEAAVVSYMSKYVASASGIEEQVRTVWDAVITGSISLFGGWFAEL